MKGLRIILTNKCSRRCSFCYQSNFTDTLPLSVLKKLLYRIRYSRQKQPYSYITVQGGEVFELPDVMDYLGIIKFVFPKVRKSIITRGDLEFHDDIMRAKRKGFKITTSNVIRDFSDRVNIYHDGVNLNIPDTDIPVTLCSELRGESVEVPPGFGYISEGHYAKGNVHFFNHEGDYGNDEDIMLPNGVITNSFKDVLNYGKN